MLIITEGKMMKFSIVVPVYNSSKFLDKCINSIIAQDYTNWELILIDDGSSDNSWEIIQQFVTLDERIMGFRQKNSGPGIARNNGIERASGVFVIFVDSDDYINSEYLSLLYQKAKNNDVVFIDVTQVDINGNILKEERMSYYENLSHDEMLRSQMTGKIMWGGVRKAVRLKLIKEGNIKYSSLSNGEENLYSYQVLRSASSYSFIKEKPVYFYVNHLGSQSKLINDDPYEKVRIAIKDYIQGEGEYKIYANTINALNVMSTIISIDRITQMFQGKDRIHRLRDRVSQFHSSIDNTYPIDKRNLPKKASIFIPLLQKGIFLPIMWCSLLKRLILHNEAS